VNDELSTLELTAMNVISSLVTANEHKVQWTKFVGLNNHPTTASFLPTGLSPDPDHERNVLDASCVYEPHRLSKLHHVPTPTG